MSYNAYSHLNETSRAEDTESYMLSTASVMKVFTMEPRTWLGVQIF